MRTDEELNKYLGNVIIASGGVCSETAPAPISSKKSKSVAPSTADGSGDEEDDEEEDDEKAGDSQKY